MSIPYFDYEGSGQPLHFLHANGYPPACYKSFLELLQTQYHVFGMYLRPLWTDSNPRDIRNWKPFSEDLLQFLESHPRPVIGVGHSIGAIVTLRAALRDPHFAARGLFARTLTNEQGAIIPALPVPIIPVFRDPADTPRSTPPLGAHNSEFGL